MSAAPRCLVLVPALTGAAVMILEMMAVRALAPVFGASTIVWTNVLGVVMIALAVGYAIGGRMADDAARRRKAFRLLPLGIALTVPAATSIRPLAQWFLPARMPLDRFDLGATEAVGSFVVALLIFGPPVTLLAIVGPLVVSELAHRTVVPRPFDDLPLPPSSVAEASNVATPPPSSAVRAPSAGEPTGTAALQRGVEDQRLPPDPQIPTGSDIPGTPLVESGAGTAAGRVLASGTLGSLAGTYLTSYVFLDDLGVTLTAGVAAVAILLASVCARVALGAQPR